jgi:hypothetical protein
VSRFISPALCAWSLALFALHLVAVLLTLASGPLRAQEVRVGAAQAWSDHTLLGDPVGVGAFLTFPEGERIRMRLGYEFFSGDLSRTGIPCAGLIPPGTCAPEPLRQEARMHALSTAVPLALAGRERFRLHLVPGARVGRLSGDTRGLESGRSLSAEETVWGADVGIEAQVVPRPTGPVRLHLAAQRGFLRPFQAERSPDAYEPFRTTISLTRWEVGVSYSPRSLR